jgi:hypothetical protein
MQQDVSVEFTPSDVKEDLASDGTIANEMASELDPSVHQ